MMSITIIMLNKRKTLVDALKVFGKTLMIVLVQLQLEDTRGENGSDSRSILLSSDHAKAVAQDKSQSSRSDQKFRINRRENCVPFMISTRIQDP